MIIMNTTIDHIAKAEIKIYVPVGKVWDALIDPAVINQYMFGTTVISDWKVGSQIVWKGEWEGKSYEDKGEILQLVTNKKLQYSHFSPLSGLEDIPENYHTVSIILSEEDNGTLVTLLQDNNKNEETKEHSEKNWKMMLSNLKKVLEENN